MCFGGGNGSHEACWSRRNLTGRGRQAWDAGRAPDRAPDRAPGRAPGRVAGGRVAFFGGTFDPPHRGHLEVARAAADRFALDRVLLVPAGVQPLKAEAPGAAYADRLEMTRLLCLEDPRLEASELDAPLGSGAANFTVDSLERLREELREQLRDQLRDQLREDPAAARPADSAVARLYVVAGADAFLGLRSWKAPERLLQLAEWIVVSRPGFALEQLAGLRLSAEQRAKVHVMEDVAIAVSATALRARLRLGDACVDWLTPPVAAYISAHHLYFGKDTKQDLF